MKHLNSKVRIPWDWINRPILNQLRFLRRLASLKQSIPLQHPDKITLEQVVWDTEQLINRYYAGELEVLQAQIYGALPDTLSPKERDDISRLVAYRVMCRVAYQGMQYATEL